MILRKTKRPDAERGHCRWEEHSTRSAQRQQWSLRSLLRARSSVVSLRAVENNFRPQEQVIRSHPDTVITNLLEVLQLSPDKTMLKLDITNHILTCVNE